MIAIKNKASIKKMETAGGLLAAILEDISELIKPGVSTLQLDQWIELELKKKGLLSRTKGYMGYQHSCCISVNDEVVHGVPHKDKLLQEGDLVKVDVCASWKGYCADMARCFLVGKAVNNADQIKKMVDVANKALRIGVEQAVVGNRLSDISFAIQQEVEKAGFGVVRDFSGHGIGKQMHEDPEILNYGKAGCGPVLRAGMTFAIEPMITAGDYHVYVDDEDGWTVRTVDKSLAVHVEDTIVITDKGPVYLTRR